MKVELDHIGIAIENINEALAFYRDALGLDIKATEEVISQGVRVHFMAAGESAVELLEPMKPNSPVGRFLKRRGPGLHHLTLRVDDLNAALTRLKGQGIRLIDEKPREGAEGALVAFIHPSSAHGVLVELKEERVTRERQEGAEFE